MSKNVNVVELEKTKYNIVEPERKVGILEKKKKKKNRFALHPVF